MSRRQNKLVFVKDANDKLKITVDDLKKTDTQILDKLRDYNNEILP
jgi:hypothetical protein